MHFSAHYKRLVRKLRGHEKIEQYTVYIAYCGIMKKSCNGNFAITTRKKHENKLENCVFLILRYTVSYCVFISLWSAWFYNIEAKNLNYFFMHSITMLIFRETIQF